MSIREFTVSFSFILGCLLITAGTVGGVFVDFSWGNLIGLAFALVHIAGLWTLVFCADEGDKIVFALRLFKISAVLAMVAICILIGLILLEIIFTAFIGIVFLFILGLVGGLGYLLVRHYFLALLSVLNGIRERVETGEHAPLKGLRSFIVVSYILIGFDIMNALFSMAGTYEPRQGHHTAAWYTDAFDRPVEVITYTFTTPSVYHPGEFNPAIIFVLLTSAGMLLCLRVLKSFEE